MPSVAYNIVLCNKEKEKSVFLMGVLSAEQYDALKMKRAKKLFRARTTFYVNSVSMCRPTFQLLYDYKTQC